LCSGSPSPVVVAVYWAGLPIISQHTSTVHRPRYRHPIGKVTANKKKGKCKNRLTLHSIVFSSRFSSPVPSVLFKTLEEESTQKGGIALFGLLSQPRGFRSLTTLLFYYRGNPRRREFVVPSFRSRSPTRSQSFSVAVPSAAVRVNQWLRSPKNLQTPSVLFFLPFDTSFHSSSSRRASKPNNPRQTSRTSPIPNPSSLPQTPLTLLRLTNLPPNNSQGRSLLSNLRRRPPRRLMPHPNRLLPRTSLLGRSM
jgi:hypothetical protein